MLREHPSFREVVDIIADDAERRFDEKGVGLYSRAVAGGQRRDWMFSGPVARRLCCPHISLYKDGHRYVLLPDGTKEEVHSGLRPLLVSDLLTAGSSAYDPRKNPPTGWVPMLRNSGYNVSDSFAVVSRLQGGEETLAKAGVNVTSFVQIDQEFLRKHSKQPALAIDYVRKGALQWGTEHLETRGMEAVIDAFDPSKKKDDRAAKFLPVYDQTFRSPTMGNE